MTFKQWVLELLKDERGGVSIKPVIALLGALSLCFGMLATGINDNIKPSDAIVNAIMIITGIGMGADTMDKFSLKGKKNVEEEESEEENEESHTITRTRRNKRQLDKESDNTKNRHSIDDEK